MQLCNSAGRPRVPTRVPTSTARKLDRGGSDFATPLQAKGITLQVFGGGGVVHAVWIVRNHWCAHGSLHHAPFQDCVAAAAQESKRRPTEKENVRWLESGSGIGCMGGHVSHAGDCEHQGVEKKTLSCCRSVQASRKTILSAAVGLAKGGACFARPCTV